MQRKYKCNLCDCFEHAINNGIYVDNYVATTLFEYCYSQIYNYSNKSNIIGVFVTQHIYVRILYPINPPKNSIIKKIRLSVTIINNINTREYILLLKICDECGNIIVASNKSCSIELSQELHRETNCMMSIFE